MRGVFHAIKVTFKIIWTLSEHFCNCYSSYTDYTYRKISVRELGKKCPWFKLFCGTDSLARLVSSKDQKRVERVVKNANEKQVKPWEYGRPAVKPEWTCVCRRDYTCLVCQYAIAPCNPIYFYPLFDWSCWSQNWEQGWFDLKPLKRNPNESLPKSSRFAY